MSKISHVWDCIQTNLFPFLAEELGPLTESQRRLAAVLELIRIEDFIPARWWRLGRPPKDRVALAKGFVAKMIYHCANTRELIDRLESTPTLRRICGWERAGAWAVQIAAEEVLPDEVQRSSTISDCYSAHVGRL